MKNITSFKTWLSVARPKKVIFFSQIISSLIPSVLAVVRTIPAAEAITKLTNLDFRGAIISLALVFLIELVSKISFAIEYKLDFFQLRHVYSTIQDKIFNKIYSSKDANFKYTSTEKMINIISNNIVTLSDFAEYFSTKLAYLFEAVTTLIVLFCNSFYVGLLIFGIAIIVYFMVSALNRAIGKKNMTIQAERDSLTETFADLVHGRSISSDLNLEEKQKAKYFSKVNALISHYKKRKTYRSLRDNFVYLFHSLIITLATIFLVCQVKLDLLSTTLFLVITPYLTTAVTKFVDFFSLTQDLNTTLVAALRIKTILSMSDAEVMEFGKNATEEIDGSITFTNVKFSSAELGTLKRFSAHIEKHDIVLFEGKKNCGKRAIFQMLRRAVRPSEGTITFDAINIYDFDAKTYKNNLSYTTAKPYFFNDSILENLKLVEETKKKIFDACRSTKVYNLIASLPEGFNTNLSKNPTALSDYAKFLLGLARAVLSESEIVIIYEFPIGLSENEKNTIQEVLSELKKERTILIFSASNFLEKILNRHFLIENGNVTSFKTSAKNAFSKSKHGDTFNSSPSSYFEGKLSH